jgi:hypothetical protein
MSARCCVCCRHWQSENVAKVGHLPIYLRVCRSNGPMRDFATDPADVCDAFSYPSEAVTFTEGPPT